MKWFLQNFLFYLQTCFLGWCPVSVPQSDARSTSSSILWGFSWCSPTARGCRRTTRAGDGRLHAHARRAPSSPTHGTTGLATTYATTEWRSTSYILPSSRPLPIPWISRPTWNDARWKLSPQQILRLNNYSRICSTSHTSLADGTSNVILWFDFSLHFHLQATIPLVAPAL